MSTDILSLRLGITNTYLLRGSKGIVMVDSGPPSKIRAFKKKLSKLYILPGDIKLLLLTHAHFDHAGLSNEIQNFTDARVMIHRYEWNALEKGQYFDRTGIDLWGKISGIFLSFFARKIFFPLPRPDLIVGDEDISLLDYGVDGTVIHTPGHTPGSLSVVLKTGEAFVGSMAHAGFPYRTKPGFPVFATDLGELKKSWKKLIDYGARIIFPAHGNPFPIELLKQKIENSSDV
ncbi:MAG TPA: MBL fold metallo-hydrolase [Bacteroidales bacterium]|nr:MBL fold metallo-hydrolase [Bacteroidales bacterium]HOK74989.1 MBL fold metallo-hydrolase [Bacteroidales bacterium]HOM41261.1 MBL fold metallo-hydrolase [Bacteroidales bacterium]HOU30773.1 MBL fold metallo-hydrolase [Bacteroidales bacterium]HPP93351.1 MBL fold metallo-hydrolase [Bacteroidales bacterium]